MIRAIIFDCFGVLTGDKWKEFVATLPTEKQQPARDLNHAVDKGFISQQEFFDGVSKLTNYSVKKIDSIINAHMHKNTSLLQYIEELNSNYKIGLLSNVSSNWVREEFLDPKEIAMFSDILLSYDVGLVKPDPKIFTLAAERLKCTANECLFVDDSQVNCESAQKIGMKAIVYSDFIQFKNELANILD